MLTLGLWGPPSGGHWLVALGDPRSPPRQWGEREAASGSLGEV